MADTPIKVSVITSFLNEEKFIRETVESVLAQDYVNWELVLVDDGSVDGSTAIARDYAHRYPGKIIYLDHPGHINMGLSASRNAGIGRSCGDWFAVLDADDVWLPGKLSAQVKLVLTNPGVAMICEASEYWNSWDDGSKTDVLIKVGNGEEGLFHPPQLLKRLYPLGKGAAPCPSGLLVSRQAWKEIGGFEASFRGIYQLYEDQAFLCKMYLHKPVYLSSIAHNRYRQRVGSLVHDIKADGKYHEVRRHFLEWYEAYLASAPVQYPAVNRLLRRALAPYRETGTIKKLRRRIFGFLDNI